LTTRFAFFVHSDCRFDHSKLFVLHVSSSCYETYSKVLPARFLPLLFPDEMEKKEIRRAILADNSAGMM
jgi:hypothetical protein